MIYEICQMFQKFADYGISNILFLKFKADSVKIFYNLEETKLPVGLIFHKNFKKTSTKPNCNKSEE